MCSSGLTLVPKTLCYVAILLCVALVSLLSQILSVRCASHSTNSGLAVAPLLRHPGLHLEPCGFNYDPVFSLDESVPGSILIRHWYVVALTIAKQVSCLNQQDRHYYKTPQDFF